LKTCLRSSSARLFHFRSVNFALADTFNTEATLGSEGCDVRLDRVEYALAVVPLPELRHKSFTLDLAHEAVRQIAFDMTAHLREVFAILNRDY
jgi:hypothetical protein